MDTLKPDQEFFHLDVTYGESYLEGNATSKDKDKVYKINIQGGTIGIKLPQELCLSEFVTLYFHTKKENDIKLYCKTDLGNDWIEVYDNFLTAVLFDDLPTSLTIEYNYS